MNILITVCARGGSKGIPGKNIRNLSGKPLIGYTIELAKKFSANKGNCVIGLSTDSEQIASVASSFGLDSEYMRPAELGGDEVGKIAVITHLLQFKEAYENIKFDYIIDLDVTSPFRTLQDLNEALDMLVNDNDAANIFSVSPANRNPYFNMVERNDSGYYQVCKKGTFLTRQSSPKVYDINGSFYIYRRSYFDTNPITAIVETSLVYVVPHLCFDLDHPSDFDYMEYLVSHNKLDFAF